MLHLVWNLIRGGTEGQCARVAMELARRGHGSTVMVFRREGYFLPMVEEACGPVREIGIRAFIRASTLTSIFQLTRLIKKQKINVVHAWDADAAIFGQFAAALAGVPFITSRRDLGQIYPAHKVWLMRHADQAARYVVANARAIKDEFVRQGTSESKFRIIPNILDAEESDRLAMKEFSGKSALPSGERVVMVTRLDPEKDVPAFIFAADLILKQHPDASFVIAGDGVKRKSLESMAMTHGLKTRMVFLGDVTEVPALLKCCSIGVLTPSRNEGLSNTILEYMAAGLPVVATDCGGNRELIQQPQGGMIVPVGDAQAVGDAVVSLLRKPALRKTMGEFNRQRVLQFHQPAVVANQFESLYRDVILR